MARVAPKWLPPPQPIRGRPPEINTHRQKIAALPQKIVDDFAFNHNPRMSFAVWGSKIYGRSIDANSVFLFFFFFYFSFPFSLPGGLPFLFSPPAPAVVVLAFCFPLLGFFWLFFVFFVSFLCRPLFLSPAGPDECRIVFSFLSPLVQCPIHVGRWDALGTVVVPVSAPRYF